MSTSSQEPTPRPAAGSAAYDRRLRSLELSTSLLQATLDATADGILVVDRDGRSTAYNARFLELWRLPPELVDAADDGAMIAAVLDQLHDPEAFQAKIQELYADCEAESHDVLRFRDGRVFERVSAPQRLGGEIIGRVWSFRDVSERHHAEAARQRSEQRFRATLENVSLIAASIDASGVVTFANDFLLNLTGWTREEVVGHDWFERFDDNEDVRRDYFECMERAEIRPHFESTLHTRTGELRTIRWSSTMQYDEKGAAAGIVTIGEDVTERRAAEDELRMREEHYRSLIENSSDVICVLTSDGTSLYESPAVERVLGWKPEELVGRSNFAFRHPDDAEKADASFAAILAGEVVPPIELRLRHRDGSWRVVASVGRLREQDGRPVVVINYRDVTERRELEEQLLPGAEDGGRRPARRRRRARLQQPADGRSAATPSSCSPALGRRRPAPRRRARDRARRRARGRAHAPAARVQPPAGAAAARCST